MRKCKYLADLGIPINEYQANFTSNDKKRRIKWALERKEYGFDERETWNLDRMFIEWIYTRVMMYKERANVDTNFYKIRYKNTKITQGQAMDKILELSKQILLESDDSALYYINSREICDLWKEVMPYMWC